MCVFSKQCSLGPNCQDQKEQLCRGAVRISRQTERTAENYCKKCIFSHIPSYQAFGDLGGVGV